MYLLFTCSSEFVDIVVAIALLALLIHKLKIIYLLKISLFSALRSALNYVISLSAVALRYKKV